MNTKEQIEDFLKFLKEENKLDEYLKNIFLAKKKLKEFLLITHPNNFIFQAFDWTIDSYNQWYKVHSKWEKRPKL